MDDDSNATHICYQRPLTVFRLIGTYVLADYQVRASGT